MNNKTPNGNELAAVLRTAAAWEREQLKADNHGRMPGLDLPAVPWLADADRVLAAHDAKQSQVAAMPIIGDATSELRRLLDWCTDPQRDVTANPYLQAPVRRALRFLEAIDAHNPSALSDFRVLALEKRA
jgi:hypothetical protein